MEESSSKLRELRSEVLRESRQTGVVVQAGEGVSNSLCLAELLP